MPSKVLQCDFCDSLHRKTELPVHIRAKHTAELAKYLVEDAKENSCSIIASYMRNASAKAMPIPSMLHHGCDYWFGVRPIMIEEKDNVTPYLAVEANLTAHTAFIRELMDHVSLNNYIAIQRNLQVRSQEMADMKDHVRQVTKQLSSQTEQYAKEITALRNELDTYKKTVEDINDGITSKELRDEISHCRRDYDIAQKRIVKLMDENTSLEWKYEELAKRYDEVSSESREEKGMKMIEMEEAYLKKIERLQDIIRTEREKVATTKKESKDTDKKKLELERKRNELKAAKAKAKALMKQVKALHDSDSDADSD